MQWRIAVGLLTLASVPMAFAEATVEERIEILEQQVASYQSQMAQDAEDDGKFTFGGYLSVGVGYESQPYDYDSMGTDKRSDWEQLSLVGLQMNYDFSDSTSVGIQGVAKGEDDWSVEVTWAYLKHRFDSGITMRAGRLGVPLYIYSDFIDVGYAYPWARTPVNVYGLMPFTSYTGVDATYTFDLDVASLRWQSFYGSTTSDTTFGDTDFPVIYGSNLTLYYDDMMFRVIGGKANGLTLSSGNTTYPNSFLINNSIEIGTLADDNAFFVGTGFSYDDGEWLVISELVRQYTQGMYPDWNTGYITFGYYIEDFLPYVTAGFIRSTDDDLRESNSTSQIFFNTMYNTYSLGVRWDLYENIALKGDVTLLNNFGDTNGALPGMAAKALVSESVTDSLVIYTVRLDLTF
ncbi:hypothetical protein [Vibrio marisflavi]|uniref:Porin domain-containing protein n=1 Tax=Vibrio marisflavi CECT 7928 TaxID=634439 RepID=A0ABM9A2J2_9VIBR|nr:hypothetical protein [Vibrio marisflavi]CAH0538843.1 hypothetical protein VMF7928_01702 [Vibrio marisflavi CECT 7928]